MNFKCFLETNPRPLAKCLSLGSLCRTQAPSPRFPENPLTGELMPGMGSANLRAAVPYESARVFKPLSEDLLPAIRQTARRRIHTRSPRAVNGSGQCTNYFVLDVPSGRPGIHKQSVAAARFADHLWLLMAAGGDVPAAKPYLLASPRTIVYETAMLDKAFKRSSGHSFFFFCVASRALSRPLLAHFVAMRRV